MKRCWTIVAVIIVTGVTPMTLRSQTPPQPSEALEQAIRALGATINTANKSRFDLVPEDRQKLAEMRRIVVAYTQSHSGKDLDKIWSSTFENAYGTCAMYEWVRFEDAENAIREAWDILDQARPNDPNLIGEAAVNMIGWSMLSWLATHPRESAALADEAVNRYINKGGFNGYVYLILPLVIDQVRYSMLLPERERREFYAERLVFLQAGLASDMVDFSARNGIACDWAIQLDNSGQAQAAGEVLDTWRKMHGDLVLTPQYCYARFFAAIHGAGGWEVANEMVAHATRLIKESESTSLDEFLDLILRGYYVNITHSDYELKRRGAEHGAAARNKLLEELRQWQETMRKSAK